MPIGIYPPTLQSAQPPFLATETSYPIRFTLQKITSIDEIGHIQVRVVRQVNNKSIANTGLYPDGTIYKTQAQIAKEPNSIYSIAILGTDLAENWEPGCLYKVQIRFGSTSMYSDVSQFATWKKQQIDNQTFSEWSTVMIIKAIGKPNTYIENAEVVESTELISTQRTEPTLTPTFYGMCKTDDEIVDKYKFDIYLGEKTDEAFDENYNENLIESSGWLQHKAGIESESFDIHRFKRPLQNDEEYTVFYSIKTINGYEDRAKPYLFLASRTYLEELTDVSIYVDDQNIYCSENGCINLYLTTTNNQRLSGSYVITRTSEESNYEVWEDIKYLVFSNLAFDHTLVFQDFTIESGIRYKYAFQQENLAGLRTSPIYDDHNREHLVNFQYAYLYHDKVQLRLMFNNKMSSFKHTTLTTKQDTLGDRYPHLVKNGYAYYAEFPVTGLISFAMDPDKTFLELRDDGFYYEDDFAIPREKFDETVVSRDNPGITNRNNITINRDLTDNNIFIERKFREKVEEFLNNFDYKLYKSPTEGNIVVVLQNVSMTPNETVGKMIYEFSATAYTIENLNEYGIIDIGGFQTLASDDTILAFGQVSGIYGKNDIYPTIKQQEEISIGGGYKLFLRQLRSFWVERYPLEESILNNEYDDAGRVTNQQVRERAVHSADLVKLNAELAKAKSEQRPAAEIAKIEAEIDKYRKLQNKVQNGWFESTIMLAVNGQNIIVAPHRLYSLTQPVSSLEVAAADYPVIVNYIAEMYQDDDPSVGVVSAIDASRIWGQVFGIFTDTGDVIRDGYNYEYGTVNEEPYKVYSSSSIGAIYDNKGNILVDATKYNLYKTLNLYEIIKEETRKQVEDIYNIEGGFQKDEDGQWRGGDILYNFSGITAFDIEADPGTTLKIGKSEDGSDAIEVKIGETGKYSLAPMDSLVRYIMLESSVFAVVNYKCLTAQMRVRS